MFLVTTDVREKIVFSFGYKNAQGTEFLSRQEEQIRYGKLGVSTSIGTRTL